jgi:hypothetical protein
MSLWLEHLNELNHYDVLLREGEQSRLAHQALEGRQKKQKAWGKVMSWLGSCLSAWGDQLQERYGNTAAASALAESRSD